MKNKTLKIFKLITVYELSILINTDLNKIIDACNSLGVIVGINQKLNKEVLILISEYFGYKIKFICNYILNSIKSSKKKKLENKYYIRPAIISILGHVNHGKTTLLDCILKTNIASKEYGGITQHISAYSVCINKNKKITILDTPGHEAFTVIRSRGTEITDIVIIVIACDIEKIPNQTLKIISHAKLLGVHIIFAFNKIDKKTSSVDNIIQQLSNINILVDKWGGEYISQSISAKTGYGVINLLKKICNKINYIDLKVNINCNVRGIVIDSFIKKGIGYMSNILIKKGKLKLGDYLISDIFYGKVKSIYDEKFKKIKHALPGQPIILFGLNGPPNSGETVQSCDSLSKNVRKTYLLKENVKKYNKNKLSKYTFSKIKESISSNELKLIIKTDTKGSLDAILDMLHKFDKKYFNITVINSYIGVINKSDIELANIVNCNIIGFNIKCNKSLYKIANKNNVKINIFKVIYDIDKYINDLYLKYKNKNPICNIYGKCKVQNIFNIKNIIIAGCLVFNGKLILNSKVKILRKGNIIFKSKILSLQHYNIRVNEIKNGKVCGLTVYNYDKFRINDIIISYFD